VLGYESCSEEIEQEQKTNGTMLIVYIALGAFILGGVIFLALGFNPQRSTRKWY